jgi:hypothetical protein
MILNIFLFKIEIFYLFSQIFLNFFSFTNLFSLHQLEANVNHNCFAPHYHWVKSGDLFLCFGDHK